MSKPEPVMLGPDANAKQVPEEMIYFGLPEDRRNAKPVIGSFEGDDELVYASKPGEEQNHVEQAPKMSSFVPGGLLQDPNDDIIFDTTQGERFAEV